MDKVKTVIRDIKIDKFVGGEIPIQIFKKSTFTFEILINCVDKSIESSCFPDSLKEAKDSLDAKDDPLDYRCIHVLPLISRVRKSNLYNQLSKYTDSFLNHTLYGFRKSHSTQHALFKLLQSWQKELDNGGFEDTVLVYLSKVYDCILHELLIANLKCYGIENGSLPLLLDYLTNRKKGRKLIHLLVNGVILIQVYHKDQSLFLLTVCYYHVTCAFQCFTI